MAHLPLDDKRVLRKLIVEAILGTDMARTHPSGRPSGRGTDATGDFCPACEAPDSISERASSCRATPRHRPPQATHKDMLDRGRRMAAAAAAAGAEEAHEAAPARRDVMEERVLLLQVLVHCADLHTPTLEPAVARRVAESLGRENEKQAEQEKGAGLKVTVMLAGSPQARAAMEIGFIQFVVRPLWELLAALCDDLKVFLDRVVRRPPHCALFRLHVSQQA